MQITFNFTHDRIPRAVNLDGENVRLASIHALNNGLDGVEEERGRDRCCQRLRKRGSCDWWFCRCCRLLLAQEPFGSLLARS